MTAVSLSLIQERDGAFTPALLATNDLSIAFQDINDAPHQSITGAPVSNVAHHQGNAKAERSLSAMSCNA